MKKVFFSLMFGILGVQTGYAADMTEKYRQECLGIISKPEVEVTSSYGKLKYNFDKDQKFLQEETLKKYAEQNLDIPKEFLPIGLTKVREALEIGVVIEQIDIGNGYTCFYPQKITAHLGYYLPTIYVLKSLKKDSCLYDLTLRHEKTHLQIYIEALDYFLPIFKKAAEDLFGRVGVTVVKKKNTQQENQKVAEDLNAAYSEVMKKEVYSWRKEVEAEQLKLDSPEHYILENKICEEIERK